MVSANQIVGFFNQPYLLNKSMKHLDYLHVDTNSLKLKIWFWNSKLAVSLKLNELMERTDFLHADANLGKLKDVSMIFG